MATLAPYYNNADTVAVSADGETDTAFGELMADGSTLPDPEIQTDALMDGRALGAGATAAYQIRVLGADDTVTTTLQTARDAGTDQYFHFTNRGGTRETVIGPAKVTAVYERPPTNTAQRGSVIVAFNVAGDNVDDFLTINTIT